MLYRKAFPFRIVTPTRILFETDATIGHDVVAARVPGALAPFEVLAGHAPIVSALDPGEVRVKRGEGAMQVDAYFVIGGGAIEVRRDGVTILADSGEWANEIDVERAQQARDRARQRLRNPTPDIDAARAERALSRATARLKAASKGM